MELGLVVGKNIIMSESKSVDDDFIVVGFIFVVWIVGVVVILEEGWYVLFIIILEFIGFILF